MKSWEEWAGLGGTTTLGEMVKYVSEKIIEASKCVENGDFKQEEFLDNEADAICELIISLFDIEQDRLDDIINYEINVLMEL